jgi:hypothetical protein
MIMKEYKGRVIKTGTNAPWVEVKQIFEMKSESEAHGKVLSYGTEAKWVEAVPYRK